MFFASEVKNSSTFRTAHKLIIKGKRKKKLSDLNWITRFTWFRFFVSIFFFVSLKKCWREREMRNVWLLPIPAIQWEMLKLCEAKESKKRKNCFIHKSTSSTSLASAHERERKKLLSTNGIGNAASSSSHCLKHESTWYLLTYSLLN